MKYIIVPVEECLYTGLHRALDEVARERIFLSFPSAPALVHSVGFYRSLAAADFPHFAALSAQEVVGWVDIAPKPEESSPTTGILGIGLISKARNQGVGANLMRTAITKAWSKNLAKIELTVRRDNVHATVLYQKLGFQTEGTVSCPDLVTGQRLEVLVMGLHRKNFFQQ
jgi:ribosomal protein S18 acetylase RimI-like enzyme